MLIKALNDYYDILEKKGKVLPNGYSNVKIHYLVCLSPDGEIDEIVDWQKKQETVTKKGDVKVKYVPRIVEMPKRTEKPGIESNIIEHRPNYLFGLYYDNKEGILKTDGDKDKCRKSHDDFKEVNLAFLEGLDSPTVNAYRNFIKNWTPNDEIGNPNLLAIGKQLGSSGYAFCVSGETDKLLHEDHDVKHKWETVYSNQDNKDTVITQCAVSGEHEPIARIHDKIKGVAGGLSTGSVLVGFNNPSESSYGNEQSYNSNISEQAMKKYSEALNYLLASKNNHTLLEDMTLVYWAMSDNEVHDDLMSALLFMDSDKMSLGETEDMLMSLMSDAKKGTITSSKICSTDNIDDNVDFFIVGLKPNSSRLSLKFIYRKKYGEILHNIAVHQNDIQIKEGNRPVSLYRIGKELVSPKSSDAKVSPTLTTKILEAVLHGYDYPVALLETTVRRVKIDREINDVRAGIIKACINRKARNMQKEEVITLSLNKENLVPAYLCGRLFAVLEKLQEDSAGGKLNRTIKDAYFASAASKPAIVFPGLLRLAQNHLNKAKSATYYNILIGEILDKIDGKFPETLMLQAQGEFMIGYYQQRQSFFTKKSTDEEE